MLLLRAAARAAAPRASPRAALLSTRASPLPPAVPARRGGHLEAWLSTFDNARAGIARLNPEVWGQPLRKDVVHSTLVWWRACQREGTHKAKGKGEVSGTGKKPFPQKGRGKARQGSRRSPQFVGGGVAHPPVPRDYSYQLPKRVRALALKVALSDKYESGQLVLLTGLDSSAVDGRTADLSRKLAADGLRLRVGSQKALLLHGGADESELLERAARNIPLVKARDASAVSLHDLLTHTLLVVSLPALEALERRLAVERRHSLAVTPLRALAIDSAAADVASLAAAAPTVGVDGLVRVIKRALPAGLARAECPASVEPLAWAAIDTRAQRLVLPAP